MPDTTLIVDDLLLLVLDDQRGVPAGTGTLFHPLGGAVLVDLALAGRIEPEPGPAGSEGPVVRATGDGPLSDPLLQDAYDSIAVRPARLRTLLLRIGATLWSPVTDRLVRRGLVRRDRTRRDGPVRTTRYPSNRTAYERDLRARVAAVLDGSDDPDPHLAVVIGLLSARGALADPAWSGRVVARAEQIERGDWGAVAVDGAVARIAAAAVAASTAASAVRRSTTPA